MLRRLCAEHGGFEPRVVYETNDIAMAQPLVASGLAVSLMPALGLRPRHEGVVVRAVPSVPPARFIDVGHLTGRRTPAADAMVEALRSAAVPLG